MRVKYAGAVYHVTVRSNGGVRSREQVDRDYRALVEGRPVPEDVAFRRAGQALPAAQILAAVAAVAQLPLEALRIRRRDSRWRAVASRMLCLRIQGVSP